MLDKIVKSTPIIGGLLVFCGVLKLIFYYSYFNIEIINYLEFQEIITSFFYDINIIVVFILTMLFVSVATLDLFTKKVKSNTDNINVDVIEEKMIDTMYSFRFQYFFIFLSIFLILSLLLYLNKISFNYFVIYSLVFCFINILSLLFVSKSIDKEIYMPNFYGFIIVFLSLTLSIFLFAKKNIQNTISNKIETRIETTKGVIICNKKTGNLYIGKTNKYEFIKLKKSNTIIVLPNKEISKYEFKLP
ncbi:hypothetical protein [Tenacibaculum aiptasiae]|uniref:hypothetical protein n=1 Tax=Tenacibaculum aiptasiae TaxID=426481 RepID=UPI003B58D446